MSVDLSYRTSRVLEMLREAGEEGCRPRDFIDLGCTAYLLDRCIDELIRAGFDVETEDLSGAAFVYRLVYEPEVSGGSASGTPASQLPQAPGGPHQSAPAADLGPEPLFAVEEPSTAGYLDPDVEGHLAA